MKSGYYEKISGDEVNAINEESKEKICLILVIKNNFSKKPNLKYIGERLNEKKEGFGIQTWQDGASYIGSFKNDRACGYGCFQHSDGDNYIGKKRVKNVIKR